MPLPAKVIGGLTQDVYGNFYTSDVFNHCIKRYSPTGLETLCFGVLGSQPGQFHYPSGLAIVGDHLFVADSWNHRIQVFDLGGTYLTSFGELGSNERQLENPLDVKLGPDGLLYILDSNNNRILAIMPESLELVYLFDERGRYHCATTQTDYGSISLKNPKEIYFHETIIYVLEPTRLVRISPESISFCNLVRPMAFQHIIAANCSQVVLYDAYHKDQSLCDFNYDLQTKIDELPGFMKPLIDQEIDFNMPINSDTTSLPMIELTSFSPNILVQPFIGSKNSLIASCHGLDQGMEQESLDVFVKSTFAGYEQLLDLIQTFHSKSYFQDDGRKRTLLHCFSTSAIDHSYLTPTGVVVIEAFEKSLSEFYAQNLSLITKIRIGASKIPVAQCFSICHVLARRLTDFLFELVQLKYKYIRELGERIKVNNGPIKNATFQTLNGYIFHLERLINTGFRLILPLKNYIHWLGIESALAESGVSGFLVVNAQEDPRQFANHLLNCLCELEPQGSICANSFLGALECATWAIEGAVKTEALLRLHSTGREHEDLLLVHDSYVSYAEQLQIYKHRGYLHKAFGHPYNLYQYLVHSFLTGHTPSQNFLSDICESIAWKVAGIRHEFAIHQLLNIDSKPGFDTLRTAIAMYENQKEVGSMKQLEERYIWAVSDLGKALAQAGLGEEAFEVAEKVQKTIKFKSVQAEIYLKMADLIKAQELTTSKADVRGISPVTLGLIHLYHANYQKAIQFFEMAGNHISSTAASLYKLVVYLRMLRFEDVATCLEKLGTQNFKLQAYYLGVYKRMLGFDQEALDLFEKQRLILPFKEVLLQRLITLQKQKNDSEFNLTLKTLPLDSYLIWNAKRVKVLDAPLKEIVDEFLNAEQKCLTPNASDREKQEHYWYLDLLLGQPLFLIEKDLLPITNQKPYEFCQVSPDDNRTV